MRRLLLALGLVALASGCGDRANPGPMTGGASVLTHTLPRLNGEREDLARYRGDVVLVVNTASECGFTPQFDGLEQLYDERRADGFVILGFPANDFAGQEPRSNDEIASFCEENFGVSFPMFAKLRVTGEEAHPLFQELGEPDWNFNKYLLDREGRLVERYGATTAPDDAELRERIDSLLSRPRS